jgi:hypothetical protein
MMRALVVTMALSCAVPAAALAHGGGLNACGCHFNRKTGECHCHRPSGCGCACEPPKCSSEKKADSRSARATPRGQRPLSCPGG